jgi:hypothetical protein
MNGLELLELSSINKVRTNKISLLELEEERFGTDRASQYE